MWNQRKQNAQRGAKDLQKKLGGRPWKTRVWFNMGWHYCCYLADGEISVYPDGDGKFHCMINVDRGFAGDYRWSKPRHSYKDPRLAVRRTVEAAEEVLCFELTKFKTLLHDNRRVVDPILRNKKLATKNT